MQSTVPLFVLQLLLLGWSAAQFSRFNPSFTSPALSFGPTGFFGPPQQQFIQQPQNQFIQRAPPPQQQSQFVLQPNQQFGQQQFQQFFTPSAPQPLPPSPPPPPRQTAPAFGINAINDRKKGLDTVFQWNILDFDFGSASERQKQLDSKEYIPENIMPLGIDRWRDQLFITTPRWKLGTPFGLSTVSLNSNFENPVLEPYPDVKAHSPLASFDCKKMISVYRTFVDECDRLWVIDAGIVETLSKRRQICQPKIIIFDLKKRKQLVSYEIPKEQVKDESLHTSITVDIPNGQCKKAFAYITDVWRYGIVVYSLEKKKSWRTTSNLHYPDPRATDFTVSGINFQWVDGTFGLSLAPLEPNGDRYLFFHPMSSFTEFFVKTSVLKNEAIWRNNGTSNKDFVAIGTRGRKGQSATVGISESGVQVYGLVQRASLGCWDIHKPYTLANQGVIEQDELKINFPGDVKIDRASPQHIWLLTNNLPTFFYANLDYGKINFRIMALSVDNAVAGTVCDPRASASSRIDPQDECVA